MKTLAKIWSVKVFLAILVGTALCTGCGSRQNEGKGIAETKAALKHYCLLIWESEQASHEAAPVELDNLMMWIERNALKPLPSYIDLKRPWDAWGGRFILIIDEGRLSALGSAGPNLIWENGTNDDIVVELSTEYPPTQPAASGP